MRVAVYVCMCACLYVCVRVCRKGQQVSVLYEGEWWPSEILTVHRGGKAIECIILMTVSVTTMCAWCMCVYVCMAHVCVRVYMHGACVYVRTWCMCARVYGACVYVCTWCMCVRVYGACVHVCTWHMCVRVYGARKLHRAKRPRGSNPPPFNE